ncbi:M16 family metallopeptidase [Geitlerinema calcuttense]|uniref:M16 family metallopeptidase n=1 Tax=Geitlerinema calcuttense TaxID=1471433 RepID=UPI0032E80124
MGHLDVYNQLTRDDVMEYYKKMYVPQNITFVIVGDVDSHAVEAKVRELAAGWKRGPLPPPLIEAEPPQLSMHEVNQESNVQLTRLNLAFHIPDLTNPDVPALDVLSLILGQGRSSRLYQEIREKRELVKSISAFAYTPGYPGLFGVAAICEPDKRAAAQSAILEMIEQIKNKPVTRDELEKAKKSFISSALGARRTVEGMAAELGSNYFATRDLDFTTGYLEDLQKVTAEDVMRVARTYLRTNNLTVTSLNPMGSLDAQSHAASESERSAVESFTLDNGIRLLVCRDDRVPFVTFRAVTRGGLLSETPEDNGISKLLGKMILKGTAKRSAEQMAREIEGVGGSIGADSGNNSFSTSVEVLKTDFDLGLEIFADVLLNPAFPEDALNREKSAQLAEIKAELEQPMTIARNLLNRNLFGEHAYSRPVNGTEPTVSSVDRERLKAFHSKLLNPQELVIAVFGDVNASDVRKKVEAAFRSLPAAGQKHVATGPGDKTRRDQPVLVGEKVDKAQAIVLFGFNGVDIKSADRFALEIIEEASSDLASRFFIRIREKMGLAYFVGARQFLGVDPGSFVFYVGTDPKKVDAVKKEMLSEIKDLAKKGLTPEEFNRAKAKLIGAQQLANQSASILAYKTALNELYGLGTDFESRYAEKIQALTLEEVNAVAAKYLGTEGFVSVVVSPEFTAQ